MKSHTVPEARKKAINYSSSIDRPAGSDYRCLRAMKFFRHKWFRLFAAFTFLLIAGDLVADAVHDEKGLCAAQSESGDHDNCPTCACSLHDGTALIPPLPAVFPPVEIAAFMAEPFAPGIARSTGEIEHPPQLA